jgi:urease accessory protein
MRSAGRAALPFAVALLLAAPAHAHGDAKLGDFYAALFEPFFHPEVGLAAIALALWSTQQVPRTALGLAMSFTAAVAAASLAALAGAALPLSPWIARGAALALGASVAASLRAPFALAIAVGVVVGMAYGHAATAAEIDTIERPVAWMIGLALGAGLLAAYANAATQRFPAFWMQVALRAG